MKKYVKNIIQMLVVLSVMLSVMTLYENAEAYGIKSITVNGSFNHYFECGLNDKRYGGDIFIRIYTPGSYTVRMKNEKNKVIWTSTMHWGANEVKRFELGNDNKVYKIYIRKNGGGYASAEVSRYTNVYVNTR